MLSDFLTALVYEIVRFLAKHPDFFDVHGADKRMDKLANLHVPKHFKTYLSEVSEAHFMQDLKLVIRFIGRDKSLKAKESPFFRALLDFLTGPFAAKLDLLAGDYYVMSEKDREKVVAELIKGEGRVADALRHIYLHKSSEEISKTVRKLAAAVADAPYILVQSPREIDAKLKKDIRKQLLEEHPMSFPQFQINRKLIGGLRVFKDGLCTDHSWLTRVLRFTSLTSQ